MSPEEKNKKCNCARIFWDFQFSRRIHFLISN